MDIYDACKDANITNNKSPNKTTETNNNHINNNNNTIVNNKENCEVIAHGRIYNLWDGKLVHDKKVKCLCVIVV